ncbi:unnamed protein product [Didymodactylos carnosus]|uniref:Uncharacterized protein n=1 Tax=Didymodactylos carnosus TaxID=1234261 RepID=A0A813RDY1_9BILA|nr:unnamed protein product [Didymodactylos carnosus]CAF1393700.1 unnamed protein product [Didymodactylos carnosus]CAF3565834.1 unnamed protein product [Didymodactylos carnosus]CAF4201173.1 unnamed protein product [Didymodactylos carnosus]
MAVSAIASTAIKKAYDIIIVGGGHNGLVSASYLARNGLRVLVCEKRWIIGGAACTEEIINDFKFSRASYLMSLFRPIIINDLELKKHGLKYYFRDPSSYTPLKQPISREKRSLLLSQNDEFNAKQIANFSHADAQNYQKYEHWLQKMSDSIQVLLDTSPPDLQTTNKQFTYRRIKSWTQLLTVYKNMLKHLKLSGSLDFYQLLTGSVSKVLDRWFECEILKATLATDGLIGAWCYVEGGMGALSECIASSARSSGVEIRMNCPVKEVNIKNSKVTGVILENGEEIESNFVASNATAFSTFNHLISPNIIENNDELRELKRYITSGDYTSGTTKINLALKGIPNFTVDPNTTSSGIMPHHQCTIHLNTETMGSLQGAYIDALNGKPSQQPMIEMVGISEQIPVIPSVLDHTLAPNNCHVALLFTQYTPYRLLNGQKIVMSEKDKNDYYRTIINSIEQYAPGFEKLIVGKDMLFPQDLEKEFSLEGGNIFHGALSLDQLYAFRPSSSCSSYRTPIDGLYLCGSSTHPGGGVTGAPGRLAALTMIQDWKRKKLFKKGKKQLF